MTSPMVFDVRKGHFPLGPKNFGPGKIFQETKSPISIHARFFIRNLAQGLIFGHILALKVSLKFLNLAN